MQKRKPRTEDNRIYFTKETNPACFVSLRQSELRAKEGLTKTKYRETILVLLGALVLCAPWKKGTPTKPSVSSVLSQATFLDSPGPVTHVPKMSHVCTWFGFL